MSVNSGRVNNRLPPKYVCFSCHEKGHLRKNCPRKLLGLTTAPREGGKLPTQVNKNLGKISQSDEPPTTVKIAFLPLGPEEKLDFMRTLTVEVAENRIRTHYSWTAGTISDDNGVVSRVMGPTEKLGDAKGALVFKGGKKAPRSAPLSAPHSAQNPGETALPHNPCNPSNNNNNPFVALFNNSIKIERDVAAFKQKKLEWATDVDKIFIQQWYKTFIKALYDEWIRPLPLDFNNQISHQACERLCELNGSPGTGKSLCALYLIHVLSDEQNDFGRPDILFVRRLGSAIGPVREEEEVSLDLLYRSSDGKTTYHRHADLQIRSTAMSIFLNRLEPTRKLMIIVDSVSPLDVLDNIPRDPEVVAHMCLYVASLGTHYRIKRQAQEVQKTWKFNDLWMVVTHVKKEEFVRFAPLCAPLRAQALVNSIVTHELKELGTKEPASASSPNEHEIVQLVYGYVFDIFGENARYAMQIVPVHKTPDASEYMEDVLKWLSETAPKSKLSQYSCEVLQKACAEIICRCIEILTSRQDIASVQFSSLFLQTTIRNLQPDDGPNFQPVAASASMHHVLAELIDKKEELVVDALMAAIKPSGFGFLFEFTSVNYFVNALRKEKKIELTGVGAASGETLRFYSSPEAIDWKVLMRENEVSVLEPNDFAACGKSNFPMIDGIFVQPQMVLCDRKKRERFNKLPPLRTAVRDTYFDASGRMGTQPFAVSPPRATKATSSRDHHSLSAPVVPPVLAGNEIEGVTLFLQSASGRSHKQGINPAVLDSHREGIRSSQFASAAVLVFLVPQDNFETFKETDRIGNMLSFKFPCPVKDSLKAFKDHYDSEAEQARLETGKSCETLDAAIPGGKQKKSTQGGVSKKSRVDLTETDEGEETSPLPQTAAPAASSNSKKQKKEEQGGPTKKRMKRGVDATEAGDEESAEKGTDDDKENEEDAELQAGAGQPTVPAVPERSQFLVFRKRPENGFLFQQLVEYSQT